VQKKSKKSSEQEELIYKNEIKGGNQGEYLEEKAAQYISGVKAQKEDFDI